MIYDSGVNGIPGTNNVNKSYGVAVVMNRKSCTSKSELNMFLTKAVFRKIFKGLAAIHSSTGQLYLVLCFQATSIPLYVNDILCYNHSLIPQWFACLLGFQALQPTSASSSRQSWELPPAPAARLPALNVRLIC